MCCAGIRLHDMLTLGTTACIHYIVPNMGEILIKLCFCGLTFKNKNFVLRHHDEKAKKKKVHHSLKFSNPI